MQNNKQLDYKKMQDETENLRYMDITRLAYLNVYARTNLTREEEI